VIGLIGEFPKGNDEGSDQALGKMEEENEVENVVGFD